MGGQIFTIESKVMLNLKAKHRNITRIDSHEPHRVHGWFVSVKNFGKSKFRFMSDQKCGGRKSSLISAINWRDEIENCLDSK